MTDIRGWLTASLVVVALFAFGEVARAENEPITVVDIAPSADALDADKLRASIATELHTRVVSPNDPLAPSAKGTLRVDVDRKSGHLTVTYAARTTPIARSIPLPDDSAAARAQAVLLAGNLARDEASELASQLRDRPVAAPQPDAAALAEARERQRAREDDERHAVEQSRLESTIAYYAEDARRTRKTLGWSLTLAGIAAQGGGFYVESRPNLARTYVAAAEVGPLLFAPGIALLLTTSRFEDLAATVARGDGPHTVAEAWARAADSEHTMRRGVGVVVLVMSGVAVAAGTYVLASGSPSIDTGTRESFASSLYVSGLIGGVASLYALLTDGPVETELHAYERATGLTIAPKDSLLEHLNVAIGSRGATAGFQMRF